MPIRPFSSPYKIGVDICHVPRIARMLISNTFKPAHEDGEMVLSRMENLNVNFIRRLFRAEEIKAFREKLHSMRMQSNLQPLALHVAGRYASFPSQIQMLLMLIEPSDGLQKKQLSKQLLRGESISWTCLSGSQK